MGAGTAGAGAMGAGRGTWGIGGDSVYFSLFYETKCGYENSTVHLF